MLFTVNDWGFLENYTPFIPANIKLTDFSESFIPSVTRKLCMLFVLYSRNKFIASPILFNVCHSPSTTICWQNSSRKQNIYVCKSQQKKVLVPHDSYLSEILHFLLATTNFNNFCF